MKKLTLFVICAVLSSCTVYAPFSDVPVKDIPEDTKSIIVYGDLQEVKQAFVKENFIVEQNSEQEFTTKPKDFKAMVTIYYQAMKEEDKTRVVAIDKRDYDSFRVGSQEGFLNETDQAIIFSTIIEVCENSGLKYKVEG